jgi:ribonuclease-3
VPEYRVISAEGPDHAREFIVEVLIGGRVLGKGKGSSKREAEQGAARAALEAGT